MTEIQQFTKRAADLGKYSRESLEKADQIAQEMVKIATKLPYIARGRYLALDVLNNKVNRLIHGLQHPSSENQDNKDMEKDFKHLKYLLGILLYTLKDY
jgi:hypothetical protein